MKNLLTRPLALLTALALTVSLSGITALAQEPTAETPSAAPGMSGQDVMDSGSLNPESGPLGPDDALARAAEPPENGEKQPQTVRFNFRPVDDPSKVIIPLTYGDNPYDFSATSDGNGAISYASSEEAVATVGDSGMVTPVGAGDTTITATAAETDTHLAGSDSYELTVKPKEVTITGITAEDLVYNPEPSAQSVYRVELNFTNAEINGIVSGDEDGLSIDSNGAYGYIWSKDMKVGDNVGVVVEGLKLSGTKMENYEFKYSSQVIEHYPGLTVKITPRPVTAAMIADIPAQRHTGIAIEPALTVTDGSKTLEKDTDYTVTYSNNTDKGTATATITGKGNYEGTAEKPFTIGETTTTGSVAAVNANPTYGDTLTVNVSGIAAANARSLGPDTVGLYLGETELATAAVSGGGATLTYDTRDKKLPIGTSSLTVKYGGSASLPSSDSLGTVTVTLAKKTLTASVANGVSKPYDGYSSFMVDLVLTNLEHGDVVTAEAAGDAASQYAGTHDYTPTQVTLNGTDKDWYDAPDTVSGSVTITAAPQTLSSGHTSEANAYSLAAGGTVDLITLVTGAAAGNAPTFAIASGGEYATLNGTALTAGNMAGTVALTARAGAYDVDNDGAPEYSAAPDLTLYVNVAGKQTWPVTVTVADLVYGDTAIPQPGNLPAGGSAANCAYSYSGRGGTNYGPSATPPSDAGSYTVTMTYEDGTYSGTATDDFTIAPATLNITGAAVEPKIYDGTATAAVTGVTFEGMKHSDQLTLDSDFTATAAFDSPGAGTGKTLTVTVTLTGSDARNYTLKDSTFILQNQTIAKAPAPILPGQNAAAKAGSTGPVPVSLAGLMPSDAGNLSYAAGVKTDANGIVASWSVDGNGSVSITPSGAGTAGQTATLPVTVGSGNYEDTTVEVTLTLSDKVTPTLQVEPVTAVYTGNPVPDSAIIGKAYVDGAEHGGTWSFAPGQALTNVADSGLKTVVFTPDDTVAYNTAATSVQVTISPAVSTGAPGYTPVSAAGKTLADAALTVGTITPAGTVKWDLPVTTPVDQGAAYGWIFTPTDAANYTGLTGSIVLWPAVPATTYTVAFNANGGSVSPASAVTGPDGRLSSLPTPTRSGSYSFDGWFTAATGGARVTTATVFTQDTTIYARWTYTGSSSGGSSSGGSSGGGSSSSGGGGSSSSSGRLTGGTSSSQAADKPSSNVDRSGGVELADAANEAAKAVADAVKAGETPRANVTVKNAESVSPETLRAMDEAAKKAGGSAQLMADTTVDGKIIARVYIEAADAAKLTGDIQLGVSVDEKDTKTTRDTFRKFFGNDVAVVRMAHQGPIGTRVQVAVKVDLAALDKKNLRFYAYDKKTNTYFPIAAPDYWIDNAGYLHFFTEHGGDIVISSGELTKK